MLTAEEGAVVGLVDLVLEPDTMLLNNIAVHFAVKGRGYGRRLLEYAEQTTREAGRPTLRLFTNALMTENIALYTRIGFVETGRDVIDGRERVNMAKRLG